MKEDTFDISDIYVGYETRSVYNDFYDEFVSEEGIVLLLKTKYKFEFNNEPKVLVFKNLFTNEFLYLKNDNSVFNNNFGDHFINDIVNVRDLIKNKFCKRKESNYRDYIMFICSDFINFLNNRKHVNYDEITGHFGDLCALYVYCTELITEEEYDSLFDKNDSFLNEMKQESDNIIDLNSLKKKFLKK